MSEDLSRNVIDGNFSSTDNLEWNQKKHDMMLNLGLTNINSDADQTPTPTRFIRNCEEVGLFQDLQNVNPFDEVFKKAVENSTSVMLRIPVSSSDDTLHTPQIYPHLDETSKCSSTNATSKNYQMDEGISTIELEDDGEKPLIIVLDPEETEISSEGSEKNKTKTTPVKITSRKAHIDKIPRNIVAVSTDNTSKGLTPIPINKLMDDKEQNQETAHEDGNVAEPVGQRENDILRQREANKAAQSRCRKRKQREFEQMSNEIQNLKRENLKLTGLNLFLQETIKKLQGELKAARSSSPVPSAEPPSTSPTTSIVAHIEPMDNVQLKKEPVVNNKVKVKIFQKEVNKLPPIAPNDKKLVSNVNAVVMAAPSSLTLPVQNNSNNTVVYLYPGYMPSQPVIVPSNPAITRRNIIALRSKSKTRCKRLMPK